MRGRAAAEADRQKNGRETKAWQTRRELPGAAIRDDGEIG